MLKLLFTLLTMIFPVRGAAAEEALLPADKFVLLSDTRCAACNIDTIIPRLQQEIPGLKVEKLDYSDPKGKKIYDEAGLTRLPAVLFTQDAKTDKRFAKLLPYTEDAGNFILLRVGASFDPKAEICGNGIDDDKNGSIDCADGACKTKWDCLEKRERPEVNVFVMSHCPYGAQMEKALLPVWKALKDKADISVKFCDYAMHGEKELREELRQTCIQNAFPDSYVGYLECFLGTGASDKCLAPYKIGAAALAGCIAAMEKQYSVMKNFEDRKTWVKTFPAYPVDGALNAKYGILGSPALVVNGARAESARTPQALLKTICQAFAAPPAECGASLSEKTPAPGFGWKEGEGGPAASCAR